MFHLYELTSVSCVQIQYYMTPLPLDRFPRRIFNCQSSDSMKDDLRAGLKKMLFRLRLANKSHAPNLFSLLLISRDPFTASRDLCQWSLEAINTDPGHRLILWWDPSPPPLPAIRCLPLCTLLSMLKDFMDQWLHPSTHRWRSLQLLTVHANTPRTRDTHRNYTFCQYMSRSLLWVLVQFQ